MLHNAFANWYSDVKDFCIHEEMTFIPPWRINSLWNSTTFLVYLWAIRKYDIPSLVSNQCIISQRAHRPSPVFTQLLAQAFAPVTWQGHPRLGICSSICICFSEISFLPPNLQNNTLKMEKMISILCNQQGAFLSGRGVEIWRNKWKLVNSISVSKTPPPWHYDRDI